MLQTRITIFTSHALFVFSAFCLLIILTLSGEDLEEFETPSATCLVKCPKPLPLPSCGPAPALVQAILTAHAADTMWAFSSLLSIPGVSVPAQSSEMTEEL